MVEVACPEISYRGGFYLMVEWELNLNREIIVKPGKF
jgi:hypothetical protein